MTDLFSERADVVLIGAGIMSATLGTFLKELEPSLSIVMLETLKDCGQEVFSSSRLVEPPWARGSMPREASHNRWRQRLPS